jgi:RHS repeat-associated protein
MGFSSKYTDSETGLVDYGLRIYSPPLARFLSRDPMGERGGINLYGFVENDPVNKWDYLGLEPRCICEITVKFIWAEEPFAATGYTNSGRIFRGSMAVFFCDKNGKTSHDNPMITGVASGGFINPNSRVNQGDDTSTPSGDFTASTTESQVIPGLMGYKINENIPGRSGMYFHTASGTQGCIGLTHGYSEFKEHMDHTKSCCNKKTVRIHVRYDLSEDTQPPRGSLGNGRNDPLNNGNAPWPDHMDGPVP